MTAPSVGAKPPNLFAIPDYRRGWLLGLLTGIARWLEFLALGVFAYEITRSPPLVALLAIVRVAPYALLGYTVGALTDRIDRKRWQLIGLAAMCAISGVMAILAAIGQATYGAVVVATLATGIFWITDMPFRRRIMLDAVGIERSGRAMGFDNITNYGTRGLGPLVGGLVYQYFDAVGVFALNFAVYAICFLIALGFSPQPVPERAKPSGSAPDASAVEAPAPPSLLANGRFCVILAITVIYNLFCVPFIGMLPVFAKKDFALEAAAVGTLASFEGVGGLIGAIVLGIVIRPRGFLALYYIGPMIYLIAILLLSYALTPANTVAALIALSVGGACFSATQYALIYSAAAPELRGRAFGFLSICIGMAMLGHWNAGWLFKTFPSDMALRVMALEGLLPMLAIGLFSIWRGYFGRAV